MLQTMQCFVTMVCGYNPPKATAIQAVPWFNSSSPVTWDDGLDFIVERADESVILQVMEHNTLHKDVVVGTLVLRMDEVWQLLRKRSDNSFKSWEIGRDELRKEQRIRRPLLYEGKHAGELVFSLFATAKHNQLPAFMPGMAREAPPGEEGWPLLSAFQSKPQFETSQRVE
mmetsp:Transcript_7427/g.10205  ORF Transcript_7427/g.10205 Transcript_7427/m.10205 type:complete len:171 (-) Transcript_7427:41-553(-)